MEKDPYQNQQDRNLNLKQSKAKTHDNVLIVTNKNLLYVSIREGSHIDLKLHSPLELIEYCELFDMAYQKHSAFDSTHHAAPMQK
jgi:hypothetical protein